jgi:hypothetical protein
LFAQKEVLRREGRTGAQAQAQEAPRIHEENQQRACKRNGVAEQVRALSHGEGIPLRHNLWLLAIIAAGRRDVQRVRMKFFGAQVSQRGIARTLGINHATVCRFIRADTFPERARYRRGSQLDPYMPDRHQRWAAGATNPKQLWQELLTQGYWRTPRMVRRDVERFGSS